MVHFCLQGAINMWVDSGAATKLHSSAKVISSFIAKVASTAVDTGLDGYTVTDLEVFDAVSDCCDNTSCFMT
jgi:predicted aspartyl protease